MMLRPTTLHEIASGKRRGPLATAFRAVTGALALPVGWYVRRKNRAYDSGNAQVARPAAPVISVGNLTVGGTGKTPMVEWIARRLQEQGKQVVLISRGYGASNSTPNDEARELALHLPEVPHFQNPDRVAAASSALAKFAGSVLLLDDAFQHRRIARDLDIVLLDALAPFGFDHLLPRGLLREPVEGLRRAQVVVLSRADQVTSSQRGEIHARAAQLAPHAVWAEAIHAPRALVSHSGAREPVASLRGKRVAAFCGIGNPAGFKRTLEQAGALIVEWREYPDHCPYRAWQLASLIKAVERSEAELVVCTHKDLVKIPRSEIASRPLFALLVGLEFLSGQEEFAGALSRALAVDLSGARPTQ